MIKLRENIVFSGGVKMSHERYYACYERGNSNVWNCELYLSYESALNGLGFAREIANSFPELKKEYDKYRMTNSEIIQTTESNKLKIRELIQSTLSKKYTSNLNEIIEHNIDLIGK